MESPETPESPEGPSVGPSGGTPPGPDVDPGGAGPGGVVPGGADRAPEAADAARTDTARFAFTALSWPSRLLIATAVGVLTVFSAWHIAVGFLYVAPANTVSREYSSVIRDGYANPEFEQNWKLFAPNPLQSNVAVEARVELSAEDGGTETTEWINLTALDVAGIRHNLLPSHTMQNELRRAWDVYANSLDDDGVPVGTRGERNASYVHRIALLRLGDTVDLDRAQRLQLRSAVTPLPPPPWDDREVDTETVHHEQEWRTVVPADMPRGVHAPEGSGGSAAGVPGAVGGPVPEATPEGS
ncbi:DUF5819 family protein [Streptomyces otsuchiensis]|uniref:DUF5819 family protein n=1 Tax=Streptomyces otsuchiensis TaxID=2681388 RepID=UPI001583A7BB|nr:DUF5819 family protein [Streptomyces otsuchiensis]